jgi:TetR/AcrR family transcriptional regulator, tetracycline repressor protein
MGRAVLSTEALVDAAIELVDREGPAALTMRRLAAELGSSPMGLYRHVDDRQGLLEAIAERATQGFELPEPGTDWRAVSRVMAHRYRAMVQEHPRVFGLLLRNETATMARVFAEMAELLHGCGLSRREAGRVLVAVSRFLFGWCLGEATSPVGGPATEDRLFARSLDALLAGFDPA